MEFTEAIEIKKRIGEEITIDNVILKVLVSPKKNIDFQKFFTDFRNNKFTDDSSKNYSTDNKFNVMGLWTDGVNGFYKNLNEM